MKSLRGFLFGFGLAMGVAALAAGYNGFNPSTGLDGVRGSLVDNSLDVPTVVQSGQTISAQLGGANSGKWVATGTTTAAGTLTFVNAAPNGRQCVFEDRTTNADAVSQTTATDGKTVVTIAGTIVSGDTIGYHCVAY